MKLKHAILEGYYDVKSVGMINKDKRISFVVNKTDGLILVSNIGHEATLRGKDKRDWDYGGWAELKTNRIWPSTGTLKKIPRHMRDEVKGAVEDYFKIYLRYVQ